MKPCRLIISVAALALLVCCRPAGVRQRDDVPRIVNIINFIRLIEPRYEQVTPDILYQTTASQLALMEEYGLSGTFLIQYDALMEPRYRELMKKALGMGCEVGAWWEITQPHAQKAGLEWRGRYPWDWHADVGFATGYSPREREMLADVYMEDFKAVFGRYPSSAGSWFIDAHTLAYMHDKYGIEASCNCKDQVGTDGYTLWGGYWSGGYYPSRVNAYMPAQDSLSQIPVPVFRMLGSDPIYQYENGIGTGSQGVESLEPVYPRSGADPRWIRYFFGSMADDPALGYTYAQVGQENSFTWAAMQQGLQEQFQVLDSLRAANPALRIETLTQTARWFRERYPVTPPSALTALRDVRGEGRRTIWFNSRFYRANMLWDQGTVRFRDIHLFDQGLNSEYIDQAGDSPQCIYRTLPVVDGYGWSTPEERAGLWLVNSADLSPIACGEPQCLADSLGRMRVAWMDKGGEKQFIAAFSEDGFKLTCSGEGWLLALVVPQQGMDRMPAWRIEDDNILKLESGGKGYTLPLLSGMYLMPRKNHRDKALLLLYPSGGSIVAACDMTH